MASNNPRFQRPDLPQCGPRPGGMNFPVSNAMMLGRPVPPPQFPQVPPFQANPYLAAGPRLGPVISQNNPNQLGIGLPMVPQMGMACHRGQLMVPWGSGSQIRGPFPNVQMAAPNMHQNQMQMQGICQMQGMQGQGHIPMQGQGQMPMQAQGQMPMQAQGQLPMQAPMGPQSVCPQMHPAMTQTLTHLVNSNESSQKWSRGAEGSSTAISSSDNEGGTYSSSHYSDSDWDRGRSSTRRDHNQDRDKSDRRNYSSSRSGGSFSRTSSNRRSPDRLRHRRNESSDRRGEKQDSDSSQSYKRGRLDYHKEGDTEKSRDREREVTKDRGRGSSRDRDRRTHRSRDRDRERDSTRDRDRARDSPRDRDQNSYRKRDRESDRGRDRESTRDKDRDKQSRDFKRPRRESTEQPEKSNRSKKRSISDKEDDKESVSSSGKIEEVPESLPVVEDTPDWVRCSPADLYFTRDPQANCLVATKKMIDLEEKFEKEIVNRATDVVASQPPESIPERPEWTPHVHHHHHHHSDSDSDSSSSSSSCDSDSDDEANHWLDEMNRKKRHPRRLHEELWYNDKGEMNVGPLCKCSLKSKRTGIRHDIFPGEEVIRQCDKGSNNLNQLYHYRVTMSPATNFLTKCLSVIDYDNHEYIFEGFSLFSHFKLENIPPCKVIRFNIEYTIHFFEEQTPENFTVQSLDLFNRFLFSELLEMVDMSWKSAADNDSCNIFHLMPRFARSLPENGKELLSMNEVLSFLLRSNKPLQEETELAHILTYSSHEWQNIVDEVRGMIVTFPGKKPSSIRIDQIDRQQKESEVIQYPLIIHFGVRPAQLSYAGEPVYQKKWKQYIKFKHLINSKPKVTASDKMKLEMKIQQLQDLRMKNTMKREVTVEVSSEGFIRTGIRSDICQHALLLPVLFSHIRFHRCLSVLEQHLQYTFQDRGLLQLSLTHTSYRVNYGTNPDHARNSLSNCGMRQVEYGDRRIHYVHTGKRGINILIDIMSRMGHKEEMPSMIPHNERLEFLGDAVVEFLSSVHLFYMFPWLEEGGLSTYRTAIVQNQHLAVLAKKLHLEDFMLYAHGPDLCHESDLKHAMANCFEALMGALFIDGGIELADRIFGSTLFEEEDLLSVWCNLPSHPLQEEEQNGDRHWIESSFVLQKLTQFEESIGVTFNHIRLLAKAFTLRHAGYTVLTMGHNQRLEFLGDTVLQLVSSEYLFRHFPEHHEGHLSLLRSSLVNNRTQAIVCNDLGMSVYVIYDKQGHLPIEMKTKAKADLLEAFLGALYVDKGLECCRVFCSVCFFPRLKDFILNQDWNDPKSQLQQCCLTLRELDGQEPDIPVYKVIESRGPTNTRQYVVAVYFRGERLATGVGHSIQRAEMKAATNALQNRQELSPILAHQKRFLQSKGKRKRKQPSDSP